MRSSTKRRLYAAALAVPLSLAFSTATTHSVRAGSNGQQIQYYVYCYANWTRGEGYNQRNQWVERWVSTPASGDSNCQLAAIYNDPGWWWVGSVTVEGFWSYDGNNGGGYQGAQYCDVPQSQQSDWVRCNVPS